MKYLSYEGLQYLYSKILTRLGLKVDVNGGDISETVIENLDTVEDKYPIPTAGESVKQFLGKTLTFLRYIKPLTSDITLYVSANTGSDTTGDGSQLKPFKTIQHAIDIIPKDLGTRECIIYVADGTYSEDVTIAGFTNGVVRLYSNHITAISTLCKVNKILVTQCMSYVFIVGFDILTVNSAGIDSYNNKALIVQYCNIVGNAPNNSGIYAAESDFQVYNCIVSNHMNALRAYKSVGTSAYWGSTSGNTNSLYSASGSIIKTMGIQPQGTRIADTGGSVFFENGTQIADLIVSGLSCTWANISGRYYRIGNLNGGIAQVVVNIAIYLTATLSAHTQYSINGFPTATASTAVTAHAQNQFDYVQLYGSGIYLSPAYDLPAGNVYLLSCTYITNS